MTLPRWVIPVSATVVAIAVAVTATLFAVRFAPPETVHAAAETLEVPVLAPVDEAGSLEALVADAGDEIPVSPTIAVREVIDPDSVPEGAVPESISSLLDDLAAADDPADVMPSGAGSIPDTPTGDPCADVEEADCPDGAPGTIMTLGGDLDDLDILPFNLWADGSASADCPAADPPSVRFWARTNRPATIQVNPVGGDGVRRTQVVETTDEQVEQWLEAEPSASGETWIEHCIEIDNVPDDRSIIVHLDATDDLGRNDGRALTIYPASDGRVPERREVPPTRIHPIGDSIVFVSAPHTAVQTVRMAAVFGGDGAEPECSYGGASFVHYARLPATEVVDAEYLDSHSYFEEYTRRTSAAIAVPANTAFIVCVGWFPAHDTRPSFERNTPLQVSEYRMTSPDVVAPVVSVTELVLTESVADGAIRLRGSTENGQSCGGWSAPPFNGSRPNVLCDFGSLLGYNDAGGSLVVTTEVDTPEGEAVNHVLLDVGLLSCVDGCSGRTRSFDVELSKAIRPTRICGDDDCFVNSGETLGVARLTATWPESTAGTGEGWVLGTWREGTATPQRDLEPSLDTTARFDLVPSDSPERSYLASATILADRPVTVVAELLSEGSPGGLCPRPGGTTMWESSGGPSTVHTVEFSGLCAGTLHAVVITLTAEDGSTRTYSPAAATVARSFWPGAGFTTPAEHVTVVVDDVRLSIGDPDRVVKLHGPQVFVDGTDAPLSHNPDVNCWVGDIHGVSSGLTRGVPVGELIEVRVKMTIQDGRDPRNPTTEVLPTRCIPDYGSPVERLEFVGYVSYSELVAGPTLTITDPDTGYSVQVRLTASPS